MRRLSEEKMTKFTIDLAPIMTEMDRLDEEIEGYHAISIFGDGSWYIQRDEEAPVHAGGNEFESLEAYLATLPQKANDD